MTPGGVNIILCQKIVISPEPSILLLLVLNAYLLYICPIMYIFVVQSIRREIKKKTMKIWTKKFEVGRSAMDVHTFINL